MGISHAADAIALGVTGPPLRASGVDLDLRRDMPYSGYENSSSRCRSRNEGDVWARYVVRLEEMRESGQDLPAGARRHARGPIKADAPKVVLPDREKMKTQMEVADLSFQDRDRGLRGSGRRGLPGGRIAARRDGLLRGQRRNAKPYRVHMRSATFALCRPGNHVQGRCSPMW